VAILPLHRQTVRIGVVSLPSRTLRQAIVPT
jgi:hypothetical protein